MSDKRITLVIMAAGIGARYGAGIKQLQQVGPNGEIIIDYSIHDALLAGFNKIVFIIRKDIEDDFRQVIGNRIEELGLRLGFEVCYAFQSVDDIPEGVDVPGDRKKPWGTGQAVLCSKGIVCEPFAVINADDYYGKKAFVDMYNYLCGMEDENQFCMAGFILKNTLSENGAVTRGICKVDENKYLTEIVETKNVKLCGDKVTAGEKTVDADSHVSMNMWGFPVSFMETLEKGFEEFLRGLRDVESEEYLLPIIIGGMLSRKEATVKVLETPDKWFGVTYKEDRDSVAEAFKGLIKDGVYSPDLFSDIL